MENLITLPAKHLKIMVFVAAMEIKHFHQEKLILIAALAAVVRPVEVEDNLI